MPLRGLRPSQFHCVIEDQEGNDACVMIEHEGNYMLWVRYPMNPLIAITCGVSRALQLRREDKKEKKYWLCWGICDFRFYLALIFIKLLLMNTSPDRNTVSDASIIILIWRVVEQMRQRGDGLTFDCILNEEKLLHLTLMCLEKKTLKAPPFDLT